MIETFGIRWNGSGIQAPLGLLACAVLGSAAAWVAGACGVDEQGEPADAPAAETDDKLPIGINLGPVSAMDRELVFVDVMKMATRWFYTDESRATGGRRRRTAAGRKAYTPVPTGEHGWPRPESGRSVTAYMLRDMGGHYPGGKYVCTWKGSGEIAFSGPAKVTTREDHRLEVEVTPSHKQIALSVRGVDLEDPIREIRFWMPGFEGAKSPFNPLVLERLRPFQVIRFVTWSKFNHTSGEWEARATLESAVQTSTEGVAVEYMVDLCNELGARPWFCMPHLADDDYVRKFATIVKERLRPDLSMYVEFSNEVWNSMYPEARWAMKEARSLGVRIPEVTAREARRDWRIWHEVFGEEKGRVVRVAAAHLHNPSVARIMVKTLGEEVDAIAVAAYFGLKPGEEGFDKNTRAPEVLAAARKNLEGIVMQRIAEHRRIADRHGEKIGRHVSLITYEGGPHIVARQSLTPGVMRLALSPAAVYAAQDLPEMYDAYRTLLEGGARAGLELFIAYYFVGARNTADSFGHLEYLDQPTAEAPKFRALVEDWVD